MNRANRTIILLGLLLITIWDTFTTIYGTINIIGNSTIELVIAVLFAIVLSGFLLSTMPIMKNPNNDLVSIGSKVLWFLALCYDLFTTYIGNQAIMVMEGEFVGIAQTMMIVGVTLFVTSAPIAVSYLISEQINFRK